MNVKDKVIKDHEAKSNQVRKLKRKLKNKARGSATLARVKEILALEKQSEMYWQDYHSWGEFNDDAYRRDEARKEARIELLEQIIREAEEGD